MYLWHTFSFDIFYQPSKNQNVVKSLSHPRAFFSCLLLYFSNDFIVCIPLRMFHVNRPSYILDSQVIILPYLSIFFHFFFKKKQTSLFRTVLVHSTIERKVGENSHTVPSPSPTLPLHQHPTPEEYICNNQWSMLTHYYHLNSIVYIVFVHSWHCTFYGFWHLYNDMYLPLYYPTG